MKLTVHPLTDLNFDVPLMSVEEGDSGISAGRPTGAAPVCTLAQIHLCARLFVYPWLSSGVDGDSVKPGEDSGLSLDLHEDGGSNLVDSRLSVAIQEAVLLDLSRELVDPGLFESYTYTGTLFKKIIDSHVLSLSTCLWPEVIQLSSSIFLGISAPLLSIRPFSLRPGSRYMLEVTASKFSAFIFSPRPWQSEQMAHLTNMILLLSYLACAA